MMINVKGSYKFIIPVTTMFMNHTIEITGNNLITLFGECFFMNRWVNNEFTPIKYILLGKGTNRPRKTDEKLNKETCRKTCNYKVNPKTKKIELTTTVTAAELLGTTEIGVANDEILISHDIYKEISATFLGNTTSTVTIHYTFSLVTGSLRSDWKSTSSGDYYLYEPNTVVGVSELDSGSGYNQVKSRNELVEGSYYWDVTSKNVYVKTIGNVDPNTIQMIVQTK